MNFNVKGFLPDNNSIHKFVGRELKIKPIGYNKPATCRIKSVLKNIAVVDVIDCQAVDRFIDGEKSSIAVVSLTEAAECLEEMLVGK